MKPHCFFYAFWMTVSQFLTAVFRQKGVLGAAHVCVPLLFAQWVVMALLYYSMVSKMDVSLIRAGN